jgi:hypothetical protein
MSISTLIKPDTGFRTHTVTGDISLDEVRRTLEDTYAHPDFRPEAGAVWDLTGATVDVPTEDVRHLADFVGNLVGKDPPGKVALLVSTDIEVGTARMYESILSGQSSKPIVVFRDIEEAKRWLSEDE